MLSNSYATSNASSIIETKELYNNAWNLVKQKVIQFTNGKKDIATEFIAQNYDIQNR